MVLLDLVNPRFGIILVFFLPLAVKLLFDLPWVMLQNFTDGVFYLGYALHFDELVRRVGLNYYSVRFGAIFPDAIAFSLLGPAQGFVVVRYLFAGLACAGLYGFVFRRCQHALPALLAAMLWALNPAAMRLQQTGYSDVAGTFFLLFGVLLVLSPGFGFWKSGLAGIFFALAAWSHLHAAIALFFFLPLLLASVLGDGAGWRRSYRWILGGICGFGLVCLAGAIWFGVNYALWDPTSPTREYLKILTEGGHSWNWRMPWEEVLVKNIFWFAPLPLLAAGLCTGKKGGRLLWGALVALCGYVGFLAYGDLFRGGFSLSMFYYFSFALPALVLVQLFLVEFVWHKLESANFSGSKKVLAALLLAFTFCGPVICAAVFAKDAVLVAASAVVFPVTIAGGLLILKNWRGTAICVGLAASAVLTTAANSSWLAAGNYWKSDDLPLLDIAGQLSKALPDSAEGHGGVRFWSSQAPDNDAKMLQSFYLHDFLRLRDADNVPLEFGPVSDGQKEALLESLERNGVNSIVVLDKNAENISQAGGWLRDAGVPQADLRTEVLRSGDTVMHLGIYDVASQPFVGREIPREEWICEPGHDRAVCEHTQAGLLVVTPRWKWGFGAFLKLPEAAREGSIRVRFRVLQGQIFIGLAKQADGDSIVADQIFSASEREQEVVFPATFVAQASYLFVRNFLPNGGRSRVLIEALENQMPNE